MFALRRVSNFFFGGGTSKEAIIAIPQGQLFLVRPLSLKGYSELIFKDAEVSIRRTAQEHHYQLVVQRVYEEGEAELLAEEAEEDEADGLNVDKDEKTFLLDEELKFRIETRDTGETVFGWKDLDGDSGDLWEFVCDQATQPTTVEGFEQVALGCQFERKYRKDAGQATDAELDQFRFEEEEPIPEASPSASPTLSPEARSASNYQGEPPADSSPMAKKTPATNEPAAAAAPTKAPTAAAHEGAKETIVQVEAELWLFDFTQMTFVRQAAKATATVTNDGDWQYWLQVTSSDKEWLGQAVVTELNPVTNFEHKSFIFHHYPGGSEVYSWLLKFEEDEELETFNQGILVALWEHNNEAKWAKARQTDQDYVMEAFQDLTMEDAPDIPEEEEEEEDQPEEYEGDQSEHYDSDESEDDQHTRPQDSNINSQLAVGYKHDRSFVVRGPNIGVFKHTPDNHLQFSTNISKVQTPGGKTFSPDKVMLHQEDTNLILQNKDNPNSLYRMDLETGQVVDDWKIHEDIPVKIFAPENKFAQMTGEQTFLGASNNALYRIDPRLSGNKMVDEQMKQYASNTDFSAASTTEQGHIAVASNKGNIRLFDRLGIRAKTEIPALGEPIIGMDVSADGRWCLATCKTYILLIDLQIHEGKNEGQIGFMKPFGKDSKPRPKRLTLSPNHVAQIQYEMKDSLSFTPARFNTGADTTETSIITATGPFVITWSLKKVLRNNKDPYVLKRYGEDVKADNFKFGSDKNLIVALPNDVNMVAKRALQRPTRESIQFTPQPKTPRRKGYLSRNDIVDSPY